MKTNTHILHKFVTPTILGILFTVFLTLAFGSSNVSGDQVTGRAVIGTITSVDGNTVTVSTSQGEFTLNLDEGTSISAPNSGDVGTDELEANEGGRVAILADQNLVNDDGTATGQASAVRISIIPSRATREHRRVIVAEKSGFGEVTIVDDDGETINADDGDGPAIESFFADDLPEQGESAILLVRRGQDDGAEGRVTGVVQGQRIIDRLSDLAGNSKLQDQDAFKSARIEGLLEQHRDAVRERLEATQARAEDKFQEVIERAAERATRALEATREIRGAVSGIDEESAECVRSIMGSVPASKEDIPPGQMQRIEVQCFAREQGEQETPLVKLIGPTPGTSLVEWQEIEVEFEVGEFGDVVLEVLVNGTVQPYEVTPSQTHSIKVLIPSDEPILTFEIRYQDPKDDEASLLSLVYDVQRDTPPRLRIISDVLDRELTPGATISLGAEAEDNGEVVSIEILVNGVTLGSQSGVRSLSGLEYQVPAGASSIEITADATDNLGNTATVSHTIRVTGDSAPEVEIVTPSRGTVIAAGTDIVIEVKAEDDGQIVSVTGVLTAGSTTSTLAFEPNNPALLGSDWRSTAQIPAGSTSVRVEVTATDNTRNTGSAERTWDVQTLADAPPSVTISSPRDGSSVEEGSALKVEINASDDGSITAVEIKWPTTGTVVSAGAEGGQWVAETTVPTLSSTTVVAANSSVPPHVFVGQVTIGGVNAVNGTTITAWIDGSSSGSRISLEATATDDGSNTSTTSVNLELVGPQVKVGETTVTDGNYTLFVSPFQGQNFTGKTIRFRVGGVAVSPTGSWEQGGGTDLPLRR